MTDEQRTALIAAAISIRNHAYARYSNFLVGAAILCDDGTIVTGVNVENASYGLTSCAERSAVFTAVGQGRRTFAAIAIATAGGFPPCGACRQVLAEFCDALPVLLVDADNQQPVYETNLRELLPGRFIFPELN